MDVEILVRIHVQSGIDVLVMTGIEGVKNLLIDNGIGKPGGNLGRRHGIIKYRLRIGRLVDTDSTKNEELLYLDVISDENFSKVEHLEHRRGVVVRYAVALENVLGRRHFPGEPASAKCRVHRQKTGNVTRRTATAS